MRVVFRELFCLLDFVWIGLHFVGIVLIALGLGGALFSVLALVDEALAKRKAAEKTGAGTARAGAGRSAAQSAAVGAKDSSALPRWLPEGTRFFARVFFVLLFLGVAFLGAFLYSYSESIGFSQASEVFASPAPGSVILESKTDVFTKQVMPLECSGVRDFVFWRELRVTRATRIYANGTNKTVFLSTFTLTVQNKGSSAVSDVLITEHIPDAVASEPGQVFNYSVAPFSVRKGSVLVDWMFAGVDAGEKKTVSYTVEKRLDADALKDFDAPNVVARAIKQGVATPGVVATAVAGGGVASPSAPSNASGGEIETVPSKKAGVDWTIPGIVAAIALVGAFVLFFNRRLRQAD